MRSLLVGIATDGDGRFWFGRFELPVPCAWFRAGFCDGMYVPWEEPLRALQDEGVGFGG